VITLISFHKNNQNPLFAGFAFFALAYNIIALLLTAFRGEVLFGRYIDGAAPLLLVFTLCFLFMSDLDFRQVLYAVIALGVIFGLFFVFAAYAVDMNDGIFFSVSETFCFAALLIVFVCCAERRRAHIISLCVTLTVLYSCVHSAFVFLPAEIKRAETENSTAYAVSEFIYNSADAPPTYVFNSPGELTAALRFLNRDTYIGTADLWSGLPDDCFIITADYRPEDGLIVLAETDSFYFIAKGERAVAYARSQMI